MSKQCNRVVAALAAIVVAVVARGMLPAAAQSTAGSPTDNRAPTTIELGRALYAHNCSHCHGPGMINAGTVIPDLRVFPDDQTRFVTTVKEGKNNRMPPWSQILTDDQIADLWAYVASRRSK